MCVDIKTLQLLRISHCFPFLSPPGLWSRIWTSPTPQFVGKLLVSLICSLPLCLILIQNKNLYPLTRWLSYNWAVSTAQREALFSAWLLKANPARLASSSCHLHLASSSLPGSMFFGVNVYLEGKDPRKRTPDGLRWNEASNLNEFWHSAELLSLWFETMSSGLWHSAVHTIEVVHAGRQKL